MNPYVIFTDSGCDIAPELLDQWGVKYAALTFHFTDNDQEYGNYDMPSKEFYDNMRAGRVAKTSALNVENYKEAFEPELKEGRDVLCLAFSSGLSNTCNAGCLAANELKEMYPERTVAVVDTLAASAGQGMLVYMAVQKKNEGASLEETAQFITDNRLHMAHWFTVDDLVYLKRGGRVSPTVALIGAMLNIKPVMHMDDEGHLMKVGQVRGRKAALKAIVAKYTETALDPKSGTVFICHGDCMDDAKRLREMVLAEHGVDTELTVDIGPCIGAHSGPGTIALFFLAKER